MTDEELIKLYWDRNEAAVSHSRSRYSGYCRSIIARILGRAEDVEECLNDVWLRAWESIPPNRPRDLKLYLGRIGRNLACNYLRSQSAQKRDGGAEAVLDELAGCIPGAPSAEDRVSAKELQETINRFLGRLPRRECDLFVRRYFYAEPLEDIAKRYALRKNTVSVTLHRTRLKLRDYLKQEGYE